MAVTVRKQGRAAPGGVDMEMTTEFGGEICQLFERVDIAGFGGPGYSDQRQRPDVLLLQPAALMAQVVHIDPVIHIGIYQHQIVATDTEQINCLAEGIMAASRHQYGEAITTEMFECPQTPFLSNPSEFTVRSKQPIACYP